MSARSDRTNAYLRHMTDSIDRTLRYVAGMSFEAFAADERTQDAVIRNLEILGEAAKNVMRDDPAFADTHQDIPWSLMYRLRNRVSHGYFDVDLQIVWSTVQEALPAVRNRIADAID